MDSTNPRFTNKVSEQFLQSFNKSPYSPEILATFAESVRDQVLQQNEHCQAHPAQSIHRLACEGSRTRKGGVIRKTTSEMRITLHNGLEVGVAQAGDVAEYPDGSSAAILPHNLEEGRHIAVVGSRLANGDEIIDTLQDQVFLISRKGLLSSDGLYVTED